LKTLREYWTGVCLVCADGGKSEEDIELFEIDERR